MPKIGQRSLKTALSAAILALFYLLCNRNPNLACIGVVFGMGQDTEHSVLLSGNRLFGVIFGGVIGMILFSIYVRIYPQGGHYLLLVPFLFIGILSLISTSLYFKWPNAIPTGTIVLCTLLFSTPVDTYLTYGINCIIDTAIGVGFAIIMNSLFPREEVSRLLHFTGIKKYDDFSK